MNWHYARICQLFYLIPALICPSLAAADGPPKLRLGEVQKVSPSAYRVDLTLDPDKTTFAGAIDIDLDVQQPVTTLWLNAESIDVSRAVLQKGAQSVPVAAIPGSNNFLGFRFNSPVAAGAATLHIEYTGKLSLNDQSGVFRTEDDGRHYLLTQFEETDARKAFPCFDEPSYKVPWQVTLHVPAQTTAISNTPVQSQTTSGGTTTYNFGKTKPLPSYLVAFGVGPFDFVDAGTAGKNRVPVRIVTPKGRANEARYAAEVSATILTRLEDYFGVPYPYEKADMVAIPISAGFAMENAGMVTFGQTGILAKPEVDTELRRRGYASVAAHELAHQWFGDLVTTEWWNDIWLNEAFATWMSAKLIEQWKPEWRTEPENASTKLFAENTDSLLSARMIRQEINSTDDIANAFDGITYQKGAAVIGMFESWIGAEKFRTGVRSYMKKYAFRTATTADFLDSLRAAAPDSSIVQAFSTFLNQSGVPVVSVALDCRQETPVLHLEQQRYLPLGSKNPTSQLWDIPLCVRYGNSGSGQKACTLMTEAKSDFALQTNTCPAWVQANDKAVGYYRVDYRGGLLSKLVDGDLDGRLSAAERVDIIGNAAAMTQSGRLSESDALPLAAKFHGDTDYHVVERALDLAASPRSELVPKELIPAHAQFIRTNFQARAHDLGWTPKPGESDDTRLLRPKLLSVVATDGEDRQLADEARALTERWLETTTGIDASVATEVLGTAAYFGDERLARRFVQKWNALDAQQQGWILRAMVRFRNSEAIDVLFNALLSGELPVTPALPLYFYAGSESSESRGIRFEFLKAHFDQIVSRLPNGPFPATAQLPYVGSGFCDTQSKAELKAFFEPRLPKLKGAPRTLAQVLESIDQCIAVRAVQEAKVAAFLEGQ